MYVIIYFSKKSINILTCVFPQSDGQAESQYAAARKATQDRFGFYQVGIPCFICPWIYSYLSVVPCLFAVGYLMFVCGFLSFVCSNHYQFSFPGVQSQMVQCTLGHWWRCLMAETAPLRCQFSRWGNTLVCS